jgi:hypothetical protein
MIDRCQQYGSAQGHGVGIEPIIKCLMVWTIIVTGRDNTLLQMALYQYCFHPHVFMSIYASCYCNTRCIVT